MQHLAEGVLEGRADAVLAASVFHFCDFTVRAAKEHMRACGIEVRL
jgi:cyclase